MAALAMMLPGLALAQDEPAVEDTDIVVGVVDIAPDGTITINGIVIDYAGVSLPSPLTSGDLVIVSGVFIDETTLQVSTFELFEDEPEDEPTEEELDENGEIVCGSLTQPVAQRISEAFDVTYDEVMGMHCEGNGLGNIVRAYLLAQASEDGVSAAEYLEMHHSGMGWGSIVSESGVHPSELAPGQIRNRTQDVGDDAGDGSDVSPASNGQGNAGGNGNGNSNNNAGGNGNGNGNSNAGG
ncbi:MAG: hypothetical protein IH587_13730, partial [Anaerolineae bacterium]|nr:hypothetical protein [Anaerolineae bacterium]